MRESYFSYVKKEKTTGNTSSKDKDHVRNLGGNTFYFLYKFAQYFPANLPRVCFSTLYIKHISTYSKHSS